jgi:hypothetical protein
MARTNKQWAQELAAHHTNLTMYHAIIELCEGGLFYGTTASSTVNKVKKICKAARQNELVHYDKCMEAIK